MSSGGKVSRFRAKGALILFAVLFLGVSDTQLVPPLLAAMAADLDVRPGRMGAIVTVFALAAAVSALLLGPLSDRIGRKRLISIALAAFAAASLATSQSSHFSTLAAARMLTGFAAGALSTLSLSHAGDLYAYEHRGRAMGILSSAYFLAFVVAVPVGALVAAAHGWAWVFTGFAFAAAGLVWITARELPSVADKDVEDASRAPETGTGRTLLEHFRHRDRAAGIAAAFLTSGGLVGFITYVGVWLDGQGVGMVRYAWLFLAAGVAASAASPVAGWLSDRAGKRGVILVSNLALAVLFLVVGGMAWGTGLFVGIGLLGVAAGARQGPLHALTTELVDRPSRGSYVAVRNAASQLGIAVVAAVSAAAFDRAGFRAVAGIAAVVTLLIPLTLVWMREPGARDGSSI